MNDKINNWNCYFCNSYNDILTIHCWNCKVNRPPELDAISEYIKHRRSGMLTETRTIKMPETDRIELHTKFYNHEKPLYNAMTLEQKRAHREEIALILLEGRARMNAIDDIDREERAKLGPKGREWLTSNQDELSSDAINQPKIRKERMSKADKLKEDLAKLGSSLGITIDTTSILNEVAKAQSGGSVTTSATRELKSPSYTFTKENPVNNTSASLLGDIASSLTEGINTRPIEHLVEAAVTAGHLANKILGPVTEEVKEETKAFNPASLFGSK